MSDDSIRAQFSTHPGSNKLGVPEVQINGESIEVAQVLVRDFTGDFQVGYTINVEVRFAKDNFATEVQPNSISLRLNGETVGSVQPTSPAELFEFTADIPQEPTGPAEIWINNQNILDLTSTIEDVIDVTFADPRPDLQPVPRPGGTTATIDTVQTDPVAVTTDGDTDASRYTLTMTDLPFQDGRATAYLRLRENTVSGNGNFPDWTLLGSVNGQQIIERQNALSGNDTAQFTVQAALGDTVSATIRTADPSGSGAITATVEGTVMENRPTFDPAKVTVTGCGTGAGEVTVGDTITLTATVQNDNTLPATAQVKWVVLGQNSGSRSKTVTVPAGGQATVQQQVTLSGDYLRPLDYPNQQTFNFGARVETASPANTTASTVSRLTRRVAGGANR